MGACNEDRVIEYVRGRFSTDSALVFERHLRFCRGCASAVKTWQECASVIREEADALRPPEPVVMPVTSSITARRRAAEERARRVVDELLINPASSWARRASSPEFLSPCMIRALLNAADEAFDSTPSRCREICALAAMLADRLDTEGLVPVPELRVEAYKDLAHVTRQLGDYAEAERLLAIAESAARDSVEPEYHRALVLFTRSILLTDMQRWSDALDALHEARDVFEDADRRRYVLTFHQESIIQAMTGDYVRAAETIADLLETVTKWGDDAELARLHTVAAYAWEGAGEIDHARDHLVAARVLHRRAGACVELALDEWRLGTLMMKAGETEEAFNQLTVARELMADCGLTKHLLCLDFDVLEAKIAAGAPSSEILPLCRRLASIPELPVNAATAVTWLQVHGTCVDVAAVQSVRQFVIDSLVYPSAEFVPPASFKNERYG